MKKDPNKEIEPEKLSPPAEDEDDRLDINKSVFEVGRELRKQREEEERLAEEAAAAKLAAKEKARREAYEKKLLEEKKELIKLKQGLVEEADSSLKEEPEEEIKRPFHKKVRDFFYHNKWWLALVLIFGSIGGVLVHSLVAKPRPDIIVLVICDNAELGEYSKLKEYVEKFADDTNGNGEKLASVYYIQLSNDEYRNYAVGTDDKLSAELQSAEAVIVIGGRDLYNIYKDDVTGSTDDSFVDLAEYFPDNPHINNNFFFLNGTPFAERVGVEEEYITDDLFIAVRKPQNLLYCKKKDMEKTLDADLPVLKRIIEDLSSEDEKTE